MSKNYAIILAGGTGTRIGNSLPKQFLKINDKPMLIHTLDQFNIPEIDGIVLVMAKEYIGYTNNILNNYSFSKIKKIISGGDTRQSSSYNALGALDYNNDDLLVFHDAARPFIKKRIIRDCIREANNFGAAGVYIKAVDTIAIVENEYVQQIPARDKMFYAQTPQAFKYKIIKEAHETALSNKVKHITDDAGLVKNAGYGIKIIHGDQENIKITTFFDLEIAGYIAEIQKKKK
jgi:2-C-methyl-D-erythritol 4-phosphate cytidylyltransferase